MKNIYRRNRKVYAHNPDPVVTETQDKTQSQMAQQYKPETTKIPSGLKVLLGDVSFKEAFAYHKSKGKGEFSYKGKKYSTETKTEQREETRVPVKSEDAKMKMTESFEKRRKTLSEREQQQKSDIKKSRKLGAHGYRKI